MTGSSDAPRPFWWQASRQIYDGAMRSGARVAGLRSCLEASALIGRLVHGVRPRTPAPYEIQQLFAAPSSDARVAARIARAMSVLRYRNRALCAVVERRGLRSMVSMVEDTAVDRLKAARQDPRPAIFLTWHAGPIFGLAALLARGEMPALIIRASAFYAGTSGFEFAFTDAGLSGRTTALLRATNRLRDGGLVVMAADGPEATSTIQTQGFGRCLQLARGPFALARLSSAVIVPMVPRWSAAGTIDVVAGEPLPVPAASADDADGFERELAQSATDWFESYAMALPAELWVYTLRRILASPTAAPRLSSLQQRP